MTTPIEPTVNKLVSFQNAYSPYVAVLDQNASPGAASELVNRIRVQGQGGEGAALPAGKVNYVLILDVSGSMQDPADRDSSITARRSALQTKLAGAIAGAVAGIESVPSTARIGAVAFSDDAQVIGELKPATREWKAEISRNIRTLQTVSGTVISSGLEAARKMFVRARCDGQTNVAILLTDGNNNRDDEGPLRRVTPSCAGMFQTQALGYGLDWNEDALTKIVKDLQGPNVPQLIRGTDDAGKFFTSLIGQAATRTITNLRVRIETRITAELIQVTQVVPHQEDITGRGSKVLVDKEDDIWAIEFPFGAFGTQETRDLIVTWRVKNLKNGDARVIADVSVPYEFGGDPYLAVALPLPGQKAVAGTNLQPNQVAAIWTDEAQRWSTVVPEVDFYTKQTAITEPLREGAAAAGRGDIRKATELLQTAYNAAKSAGATAQLSQIETLVKPRPDGTVELRADIDEATVKEARLKATTSTMMTTDD